MATVDAKRMSESRAIARDLRIPNIADSKRRAACEQDDCEWLRTYCSDVFYNPFTPHQLRIAEDCAEALKYGTQKCKAAPRGDGKALSLSTPLPTPAGWTTMGEVAVGDQLIDERGCACRVIATTAVQRNRPCYRVKFSDGHEIVADAEHLWAVRDRWAHDPKALRILSTQQMAGRVDLLNRKVERRYSVPLTSPLLLPASDIPLDPYTLGIWLGDGAASNNTITVADDEQEILEHIGASGVAVAQRRAQKPGARCKTYLIGGTIGRNGRKTTGRRNDSLLPKLRLLGLLNNKHIPRQYLRGSIEQRYLLLQGLMDSDGHANSRRATQCEFVTNRPALRDGVLELLASLGIKATTSPRYVVLNNKKCGPYYRILFTAYNDTPVFRIHKKSSRLTQRPESRRLSLSRQIVEIEPVESVPVKCIQVDSPSRLYLAGRGMIPTHNSSIVKYLALKYGLTRQVSFPLIVCATFSKSKKTLDSLKRRLAARTKSALSEDYPLECAVARYVHPWPSRARNVTANGRRSVHVEWAGEWFVIPTWEAEEPLGPILMSLGITSDDLQGCNVYDRRPDFVMLDDLDSRDSLAAADGVVAGKIEETVDKSIAGLGGQSRRLGKFMLCTITSRASAAFKYSDPNVKPSWSGERISAIVEWPTRTDLWETYIELRNWGKKTLEDRRPVDPFARKAHAFYLDHRDEMDAGSVLSNPHNFEPHVLRDGSRKQVSALQRCYDYIADEGLASFLTEHQNDPPEDTGLVESGINVQLIQRQVSGFARGVVPDGCTVLVQGVDVGKWKFHWVVRAFKPDGTGYTIDYDYQGVYDTKYRSEEGLDRAIHREILRRMAEFREMPYAKQFRESLTLVDSGYRTDAVYAACCEAGMGVMPVKGIGQSAGCAEKGKFTDVMRRTRDKVPVCDGVSFTKMRFSGLPTFNLACADADQWKAWEHDRWQTAIDKPGCMFLWGDPNDQPEIMSPDQRAHQQYASHICAEVEVEEDVKGVLIRRWKAKTKENHWFDASYYADVAAAILGVRVIGDFKPQSPHPKDRPTAAQLASVGRK